MRVGIIHVVFFFSSRRRHTRCSRDWSSDVCSSDLKELRDYSPIPGLWSRIERALIEQDGRKARRPEGKWWFSFLPNVSLGWQTAVAGAFALILTASVTLIISRPVRDPGQPDPLPKNAGLKEVEKAGRPDQQG